MPLRLSTPGKPEPARAQPKARSRKAAASRSTSALRAKRLEQRREDFRRGAGDFARFEEAGLAAQVADESARFLDEKRAGGHVPRRQSKLPERIEPAARHVGKVERRGARAAHARALLHDVLQLVRIKIDARAFAEREAGADQGIAQAQALRNADAAIVQICAAALRGGEQLIAVRVVDHAVREFVAAADRDRDAVPREAGSE